MAGDAKIELPMEGNEHEVDLAFNPDFLIDVLRVTTAEALNLEFSDFNRPVLLKSEEGYLNLVMPISSGA
jgi:DNA polymerase III sliding clamp (beta) subunit (PCNA family)